MEEIEYGNEELKHTTHKGAIWLTNSKDE